MAGPSIFDNVPDTPPAAAGPSIFNNYHPDTGELKEDITPPKQKLNGLSTIEVERENNMLAGPQFTTPIVKAYEKNYVGDAHIMDDNSVAYTNDKGEVVPTDKNKHVVLKDTEDGKYKVYKRSEDTDLGPINGRMVAFGHLAEDALATVPISHGPQTILAKPGINFLGWGKGVSPEAGAATSGGNLLAKGASGPAKTEGAATAETAARLGTATNTTVNVPKVVASDSGAVDTGAGVVSKLPISGAPLKVGVHGMGDDLANAAQGAADAAGGGTAAGAQTAGESVRAGVEAYTAPKGGVLSKGIEDQYDKVGAALNKPNYTHELANTQKLADQLTTKYTKAGITDPGQFPDSVKEVLGPLTKEGGLDYNSIRFVRTKLGQLIGQPDKLPSSVDVGELKQLYGALKDDTRDAVRVSGASKADPSGDKAVGLLDRADKYAEAASRRRETLVRLLGPDSRSDEGLFHTIMSKASTGRPADIDTVRTARKAMSPDQWNDVSSAVIGRLGKRVGTDGEYFDPGNFVKDWSKISEAGKSELFGGKTTARQALDDLATLSKKYGEGTHLASTGGIGHGIAELGAAGAALYAGHYVAQAVQSGHWVEPLTMLGGLMGGRVAASVVASPVTARSAVNWARAYEALRLRPGSVTVTAFNNASRDLEQKAQQKTDNK